MSYQKQNFANGEVLSASQLNHIEDGIVDLEINSSTSFASKADKSEVQANAKKISAESARAQAAESAINETISTIIDPTLSLSGKAADAKATGDAVGQLKDDKLDKPETPPTAAGKILRVLEVNKDGTFTCEWADAPSGCGAVDDVQINGTSILSNGVADIPLGSMTRYGLVKGHANSFRSGIQIDTYGARLGVTNDARMNNRSQSDDFSAPIQEKTLDMSIKHAMCDGKGAAWTDTERIAALLRMGCTVDDNGFVKWGASE